MSSLYVQCLKSRVEKAWKEEMANNHTKVDSLHTEKRDHVPVHHHYRKRACHHADHVQVKMGMSNADRQRKYRQKRDASF